MNNLSWARVRKLTVSVPPLSFAGGLKCGAGKNPATGWFAVMALVLLLCAAAAAQDEPKGVDNGNYHYQGSFDLGYRFVDTNGSPEVYNTYVDEHQGPRLLEQTLNIRSLNHAGTLFDNLFMSSFGWGGDAENATRLRISKNKWYNFNATFRRDRNFWDYNLQTNPFNPATSVPNVPINDSVHAFQTVRRMYDYNLTLLPQSAVRFRLGYSRNNMEGPALSTVHEGTDTVLFQNTRTLIDSYHAGVDIKVLPRTNISYDQFLQYYRGDTSWSDQVLGAPNGLPFQPNSYSGLGYQLSTGTRVDPGGAFNTAASQPCATPTLGATTPPTFNPACNGYLSYSRSAPTRVSYPTEQLTLQSNYFRRLDLSGRASYNSSDSKITNLNEAFAGLITRTRQRQFGVTGPSIAKRVVASADLGVTIHVTDKLRIVDTFRFSNFRIPGSWGITTSSLYGATLLSNPNVFSAATCPPPFTAATCPQHNASSGADLIVDQRTDFLKQDQKLNTIELEYDIVPHISTHIGYRFERRTVVNNQSDSSLQTFYPGPTAALANRGNCAGVPLNPDGTCTVTVADDSAESFEINGHSFLAGFAARPTDALRLNFDAELFSADYALTRISPRNLQRYKLRANYQKKWLDLSGTMNILESRNNETDVFHKEHNRNYGFALSLNPKPKFSFDLGYNYDDVYSTTNICYVATPAPTGTTDCGAPFLASPSIYKDKINFVYSNIMVKPVKRVTAYIGYNLTSTSGSTLILNPVQGTLGSLAFNFHRPSASFDVDLGKGVTWRTAWNYHDYNEKSAAGIVSPRDFQSNAATLSLRYAF